MLQCAEQGRPTLPRSCPSNRLNRQRKMSLKIEDYGLIGNTYTSALVSRSGSIDWMCVPRFDSDACFAALLGYDEHGRWSVRPTVAVRKNLQSYRSDTMILETEFACDGGAVRVIDFMPMEGRGSVIRIIEGLDGEVPLEMLLDVRFGYGANAPFIKKTADGTCFLAGPDALMLRSPVALDVSGRRVSACFPVKKGDRIPMQLAWFPSHEEPPAAADADQALAFTERFWQNWVSRCTYRGRWRDAVVRSLLTLKAMTFAPTGAIVAAPTTSLPESLGGVRNWDYRFCWMRDTSFTLGAFMAGGYIGEAQAFRNWAIRTIAGAPADLQIMYDIFGGRRLTEFELDPLPGYEGSKPVRVGNAASGQFQLDVYGEAMSAWYLGSKLGLGIGENWGVAKSLIDFMENAWQRPDDGIWEVRGGRRHFTHSKVMAWVFFDRAAKAIQEFGFGGDEGRKILPHINALRERIHTEVCDRGFNPQVGAFTQSYGSDALDASVLLIPQFGFLPGSDPRMLGTVAAIEKHLLREGFVLRYDPEQCQDGLPGSEGAFLACTYWLADNYAFAGRVSEAEELFERLLSLRNHLGLLSEEYDFQSRRQIGNFPQAFSHLALIIAARNINSASANLRAAA
jgi:GH15 family glucan-1,4-alpha-glucosidase